MIQDDPALRQAVIDFCARIGTDPLLTQGAGGNVSWKHEDSLWIKASGTWLAEAAEKNIFVPVSLSELRTAIAAGQFDVRPAALDGLALRPSIETTLHALMPHRIVVHVHAVEALACLVRTDWLEQLNARLGDTVRWAAVPYRKPGAELAQAVHDALAENEGDLVFLQSHGVVIGGDTVADIERLLGVLDQAFRTQVSAQPAAARVPALDIGGQRYHALEDASVQALAFDNALFERAGKYWALYPDHVVFLGPVAPCFESIPAATDLPREFADLLIVRGVGVFVSAQFNAAKQAQLRCYSDVIARQPDGTVLHTLDVSQIQELLNWDSERYRMSLAK